MVMDRAFAFARLAELMPAARERFGVRDLAVFGSVSRGEASDASDLDVIVDFFGKATFDGYMGLKLFLGDSRGQGRPGDPRLAQTAAARADRGRGPTCRVTSPLTWRTWSRRARA
jgi:hypothetical protein